MSPEEIKTMLVILAIIGFAVYVTVILGPPRKGQMRIWLLGLVVGYLLISRLAGLPPFEM